MVKTGLLCCVLLLACCAQALVLPSTQPATAGRRASSNERHLRLSLYQGPVKFGDTKANLDLLEGLALQAGILGSDLLMVPELFLSGYTFFTPEQIHRIAEFSDGAAFQTVANIARMHNISILYAYGEKDKQNTSILYDSAQLVDNRGVSLLNHRKVQLASGENMFFTPGRRFGPVVELHGIRVGVLICYEVSVPEAARELALQKAEVVLIPTANGYPPAINGIARMQVPVRAGENGVHVAYCNFVQDKGAFPFYGLSTVAAPDGSVLLLGPGGVEANATALLTVDIWPDRFGPQCNLLGDRLPAHYQDICDLHAYCLKRDEFERAARD